MFNLDAEIMSWWLTNFVEKLWFRGIKKYLPAWQKILQRVSNWLAYMNLEIERTEVIDNQDPDIYVETLQSKKQRYQNMLQVALAREPIIMNDPNVPTISKIMFKRDIYKYQMQPREIIYRDYWPTKDELRFKQYKAMINEDIAPKNFFIEGMDYFTYYIYLQSCKPTKVRDELLKELINKMIWEWQWPQLWWPNENQVMKSLWASNASQMTSNLMKTMWEQTNVPGRQSGF